VIRTLRQRKKIPLWIGYGLTSGLQILTVIALARFVGREVLGQYAAIIAFTLVIGRLVDIGLPAAISYFIRMEPESANAVSRRVLLHIAGTVPVVFGAAYLLRFIPFAEMGLNTAVALSTTSLAVMMLAQLASGLFANIMIATDRYTAYTLLQAAPQALLCGAVYTMHLMGAPLSIVSLLPVLAATAILPPLLIGAVMVWTIAHAKTGRSVDVRELYSFGFQTLPGNAAKVISARLDRMILSAFLSASSLGLYAVGMTVKTALLVPFQAYGIGLFNDLLDEKKAGRSAYDYNMRAAARWFAAMLVIAFAVFATAPYAVPLMFGPEFASGVTVVRILAFAPAFECLSTQMMQWLLAERHPTVISRVQVIGAMILAISMTVGSIGWGLLGAAYAATLTAAFMAGCTIVVAASLRRSRGEQHDNDRSADGRASLHSAER